jgi:hypothetical protein
VFGYNSLKGIQRERKLEILAFKKRTPNTTFIKQFSQQLLNIR